MTVTVHYSMSLIIIVSLCRTQIRRVAYEIAESAEIASLLQHNQTQSLEEAQACRKIIVEKLRSQLCKLIQINI